MSPTGAGSMRRIGLLLALGILVGATALRFVALEAGLPLLLTRPDEETVLAATGELARHAPLSWATYPSAYLWTTWRAGAVGLLISGGPGAASYLETLAEHPDRLIAIGRRWSAFVGTATVLVLMVVSRRESGPVASLIAATLLGGNLLHVRDSHALKPEAPLTLLVTLGLAAIAWFASTFSSRRAIVTGGVIGLACGMKYPAFLLLFAMWAVCIRGQKGGWYRRLLPMVCGGAAAAAVFVATNLPIVTSHAARQWILELAARIFPWALPNVAVPPLPEALGHLVTPRPWWWGWVYHATFSLPHGLGMPATLLAPIALVWALRQGSPLAQAAACFFVAWFAVNGATPMALARYMTPVVPAIAIVEAELVAAGAARCGRYATSMAIAASIILAGPTLSSSIAFDALLCRRDTRLLAGDWLADNLGPGARVAIVGTRLWGYGEPRLPPGTEVIRLAASDRSLPPGIDAVVTHEHPTFASRIDQAQWLALSPALTPVADFDPAVPGRSSAIFEELDAYYVPIGGFSSVRRPGPHIRIFRPR